MKPELSETQQQCLEYIKAHGGTIKRHTGGYWAHEHWKGDHVWFSTGTIQALVTRNLLEYTGRVERGPGYGQPAAATLTMRGAS